MEDTARSQQSESNISPVIWILALIVCLLFDALSLIPIVGDIEDIPAAVVFIVGLSTGIFKTKVGKAIVIIQGFVMGLKLIPVVQEFPLWSIGWLVAVIIEVISKVFPAIKPAVQLTENVTQMAGGDVGEVTEGAAATGAKEAESVAARQTAGGAIKTQAEKSAAQESVRGESSVGAPEGGEALQQGAAPEDASSVLDQEGGNAIGNLQEEMFEPAKDNLEPQAPTPFKNDAGTPTSDKKPSNERKRIHLVDSVKEAAQNTTPSRSQDDEEEEKTPPTPPADYPQWELDQAA